jgi:hypothetical protein
MSSQFASPEARMAAENGALRQMFAYAAEPQPYTLNATEFKVLTDSAKDMLGLAIQGLARLLPDVALMVYEIRQPDTTLKTFEVSGPDAYQQFANRYEMFADYDFGPHAVNGMVPLIHVMPQKGARLVDAVYAPADFDSDFIITLETEYSSETLEKGSIRQTECMTEIYSDHVSFHLGDERLDRCLTLSGEHDEQFLASVDTTETEVGEMLRGEVLSSALREGGLYGLGSYLLWRSVRDLCEVIELPPNAF